MKKQILLVAALAAAVSCGPKQAAPKTEVSAVVPAVRVVEAQKVAVPHTGVYSTTVLADVVNNIAPQTGGRIVRISAEVGDFVKAGQVLAEMDKAQLEQLRLQIANNEKEFERISKLHAKGGVSQSDYDAMKMQLEVSRTSFANLEENTILRSPIDGVVSARSYDRGDMYTMASPLFTVQKISPVKMYVGISEKDYTKVHVGDKVRIEVDAFDGRVFEGKVTRVNPTFDAATHTVQVEVKVPNTDVALRPGMYARATVTFEVQDNVVLPDAAVVKQQGSGVRNVFVLLADGTVEQRVVTLGVHRDAQYEILSGVQAGEKVVVKGQAALKSGIKVEVLK